MREADVLTQLAGTGQGEEERRKEGQKNKQFDFLNKTL
jgi:hypothetical protein